jgi:hypothetical protein
MNSLRLWLGCPCLGRELMGSGPTNIHVRFSFQRSRGLLSPGGRLPVYYPVRFLGRGRQGLPFGPSLPSSQASQVSSRFAFRQSSFQSFSPSRPFGQDELGTHLSRSSAASGGCFKADIAPGLRAQVGSLSGMDSAVGCASGASPSGVSRGWPSTSRGGVCPTLFFTLLHLGLSAQATSRPAVGTARCHEGGAT